MVDIKIENNGTLKLPKSLCDSLGADPLKTVSSSSGHLFLGRPDGKNPVLLSGILEAGAIPDLLSYFNMFRKTGILSIQLDGGTKSLYFQDGEVVFATSSFLSEDIGEMLFSLGKIDQSELQNLRLQVTSQTTLGKLLVEDGAATPKDLWLAARSQVENIVYNLFTASRGGFYFQQRAIEEEKILRLSMSTQNMIMEGLRRLDEKSLFMRKIISLDYYPRETGKDGVSLSQNEARFMKAVQVGQDTASELFRKVGLREFDGIRVLYGLLEKKLLSMEDSPMTEIVGALGQILATYNSLFMVLFARVESKCPEFLNEISQSLRELPPPYSFVLRDVDLREDGTLDGYRVVSNLSGLEEGDKNKLLADSLCEVAFVETMVLRRELEADQARPLIARVQEVTTRIRDLVGRNE